MVDKDINKDFILLNVGKAFHNADWNWKNIYSPFARIHYIESIEGKAGIVWENKTYELRQGHLYLTPAYTRHGYECDGALTLYYIHIYEDLEKSISIFDLLNLPVEIQCESLDGVLVERLLKINPEKGLKYYDPQYYDNSLTLMKNIAEQVNPSFAHEMESQGILQQLISRFVEKASYKKENMEERIQRTLHYISKNIDKPIDIQYLADMIYLSKDHFIRLFREETGDTPGKYINRKKMEKAQLMILVKDMPIKDIAYSLGIDNVPYFNRTFKKATGYTPSGYRKIMLSV